ncbi:MAG: imidazole glycerol phosphate synthase subunit HisH [Gemmatimonadetes bacterium]|nr:imidazole glycerol phosphate synthase subunit HisH [Gemmatimonadota bacterium]
MNAASVAVIDYGAGNLGNARRALDELGFAQQLVRGPADLPADGPILLPGVGNYGAAMQNLDRSGLARALRDAAARGRRTVGICLGLQLLFATSEEAPGVPGLGVLAGRVRRLEAGGRPLPHLGWCAVGRSETPLYFAHSFVVAPADPSLVAATAEWGERFPAIVTRESIVGFQFHPERSGDPGLEVLARSLRGEELGV